MQFSFKDSAHIHGETHLAGRFERRNGHLAAGRGRGGETLGCCADGLSEGDGARRGHWCTLGQNPSCGKKDSSEKVSRLTVNQTDGVVQFTAFFSVGFFSRCYRL